MISNSPVLLKSQLLDLKKSYIKRKDLSLTELKNDFPLIYHSLEHANGVSDYRVICCDSLSIWFLRASQMVNLNKSLIPDFLLLLDEKIASFLFEYVIDFWNESGAPLGNSLREMFIKMITFLNCIQDSVPLFQSWLIYVLNTIPLNLRVSYFMVETLCNQIPGSSTLILENYSNFITTALSYMWSNALANPVGKALQVIFKNYHKETAEDDIKWLHSWDELIIESMKNDKLRKNIQNYLLLYLFKVSPGAFKRFVKELIESNEEDELSIMLISLRIGQELGIVEDTFEGGDKMVSIDLLSDLMSSDEDFFRIESFSLLTLSPRGSKPISSAVLDLVLEKLNVFLTDVNLETRNEFVALFKKFITRLRDSIYAINRNSMKMLAKNKFIEEANEGLAKVLYAKIFLEKLILQLIDNMRPGASFQRCNLAMKILNILVRSGLDITVDKKYYEKLHMEYPFHIDIYKDPKILRVLIDNITNDFEEIRDLSVNILSMSKLSVKELLADDQLNLILERSFDMLGDLKGRRADAGAKILQFIFANGNNDINILKTIVDKLNKCTDLAKKDFIVAVYESNIHGYYLALNAVLNGMKSADTTSYHDLLQDIIHDIFDVWTLTKPVLTHDSPEGNLPEEMQKALEPSKKHLETKFGPATQVILSYSWRSVKESTALLASILATFSDEILFEGSDFSLNDIGELIIDQLSTIRHPGAFSSVYPTFLLCCDRCFRMGHNELPEQWLQKNLLLIEDKCHSITRRSGGLPFLTTAILTAEYKHFKSKEKKKQITPLFQLTFEKLFEIASQPFNDSTGEETLELPQVHALNSIRFLFVESKLSELSNHYMDRSLDLALGKFSSKHWSMRNASVMLFTTLQNRLFGTKKIDNHHLSTISARLFFSRYKRLQPVLLKNFETALSQEEEVENLFPILTILSRLHSTPGYNPVLEFKPLLLQSLKSKYWKVREMAARALPSIINEDSFYTQVEELISLIHVEDNNEFHGFLFAIKELLQLIHLRSGHENDITPTKVFQRLCNLADGLLQSNYSCATTYVEILDVVLGREGLNFEMVPTTLINKLGYSFIEHNELTSLNGAKQLFMSRLLIILLKIYTSKQDVENLVDLLKLGLFSELYECQLSAIEYISSHIELLDDTARGEMIQMLWSILESELWSYVKASSLLLLKILLIANDYQEADLLRKVNILLLFIDDPSEDVKSTALECLGPFVSKLNDEIVFKKWYKLIITYSGDEISYHLRFASLKSCKSFIQAYVGPESDELIFTLIKLYQFLYDDDDEIRDMVSSFISRDLMKSKLNLVSVEVEKRFPEYLRENYDNDKVAKVVFENYAKKLLEINIEIMTEYSLFNVEKNNFYRNIIDELQFYIKMLPSFTEQQREIIKNEIESQISKVNTLFNLKDDILGIFRNEDHFNFAYIIMLNYKELGLKEDSNMQLQLNSDTHPLIRELLL